MVLINLFGGQQQRWRHREQTYGHQGRGRRGWVSVLTVNHCSAHNLQPKRYLPSKLMPLVHSRMRQSTTSSNMVVLGNIWEQTAETSVWLAVVRK